jgi:hypothetical protein
MVSKITPSCGKPYFYTTKVIFFKIKGRKSKSLTYFYENMLKPYKFLEKNKVCFLNFHQIKYRENSEKAVRGTEKK